MKKDLYRSRLEKSLDADILNFLSSFEDDLWIIEEDILGTEVHTIMLHKQGILTKGETKVILKSLDKLRGKIEKEGYPKEKTYEDIHPYIEKFVIEDIGMEIGGKIHTGRSRNDQVALDIRLKIRKELNGLSKQLFSLLALLIKLSKDNVDAFMPLYTHFQKAQLGQFSHYINNYSFQILRTLERIEEIYGRINRNPLGACAIGGTSININRQTTSQLLGFKGLIENSIDAISSKDYLLETLMILCLLAIHLSRIAEDLLLWSTKEFDFIEVDEKFCSVSSVMPQKKNPDTIELIRAKSSIVITNLNKALMITKAIPTGYYRDFQELKPILRESFTVNDSIIRVLKRIFSNLKINKEVMTQKILNSYILALDLAELLVSDYHIPFRLAHQIVGNIVKKSHDPQDLFDIKIINQEIKKITPDYGDIRISSLKNLKDFNYILGRRTSKGSPSKSEIFRVLHQIDKESSKLHDLYLKRTTDIINAEKLRQKIYQEILR